MAMGLGTFMAKVAAVKNKKEATSTDLNKMDVFMSIPLPKKVYEKFNHPGFNL
jgi:hypothetical protein